MNMWEVIRSTAYNPDIPVQHSVRDMPICQWRGSHTYRLHSYEGEFTIEECKYGCGEKRKFPTAKNSTHCVPMDEIEAATGGRGLG